MELSVQEQIFSLLRKANKVLIVLPQRPSADAVASGLALRLFLVKLQKDVDVVCTGPLPANLGFLPGAAEVKTQIAVAQSLVVHVNTAKKQLDEISYQVGEGEAQVFLKSRGEAFTPEDLSFAAEKFPVDVIVALDAASLQDLGGLLEHHADLLFETPKINIDHKAANDYFGAVNLVDISASSVGEILAELLESFEASLLDADIATCLLAGIITKTGSFQQAQTTPRAFLKASRLVELGGQQQEIVRHLYKTRSLEQLKLWGRCLARLQTEEAGVLAYCVLGEVDFQRSGATAAEVLPALQELVENLPDYKFLAILAQLEPQTGFAVIAAHAAADPAKILNAFSAASQPVQTHGQVKYYTFPLGEKSLEQAQAQLLAAAQ
ncbi:MAG: hypothetical protein KGJ93_00515 [Patescibacteria group bacterium]|nr:hypothetical protein [Patescibacteria group bacterium]